MDTINGPKKLSALFKECVLRVPAYQRAYSWLRSPHLRDFLNDLTNHPRDQEKSYFYGTILLSRAKDVRRRHLIGYDVVDGQQRITTACIFVAAMLPRLREGHDPDLSNSANLYQETFIRDAFGSRKFETIRSDDGFFEHHILQEHEHDTSHFQTPSQKRLYEAKRFFTDEFTEQSAEEICRLLAILYESQVLVYAVDSDLEATQIFELQNDRGKPLTNLEALKSFLMHGLYLHGGQETDPDLSIVQEDFAAIYRAAEQMEERYGAPGEDELLRYHCIACEERRAVNEGEGWDQPKSLVRRLLQETPDEFKKVWIKQFTRRLRDSFEIAIQILDARDTESCIPLGALTILDRVAPFWPLALKCWRLDRLPGRPDFDRVVRLMTTFTFRSMLAGKRKGDAELRRLANSFAGAFADLINRLEAMCTEDGLLETFGVNLNSEHFYEWWGVPSTYLLWQYENHLRSERGYQMPRLSWKAILLPDRPAVKHQRDHIEPKDPANPRLSELVKWDEQDEEARPFSEVCLHRLGNLVLDTYSTGASKGNSGFASRIHHYTRSALLSQGELVSRFATRGDDGNLTWDVAAIKKRQATLSLFAMNL